MKNILEPLPGRFKLLNPEIVCILGGVCLFWFCAFFVNQIWEDFLISFRFAENWLAGIGLVYNAGERIQGFSSPLVVILASALMRASGSDPEILIWSFRAVASIVYVFAGFVFVRTLQARHVQLPFQYLLVILYLSEFKTLIFSTNGMETPFFLFFLSVLVYTFSSGKDPSLMRIAICFAGLVWTRPDGVVYILVLSAGYFLFLNRSKAVVVLLLKASILAFLFYSPWLIFSWWYYGSPIPHTVIAKSIPAQTNDVISIARVWLRGATMAYLPAYHAFGGWPSWMQLFATAGAVLSLFVWIVSRAEPFSRFGSFVFFCLICYLYFILIFPWYLPPVAIFGILVACSAAAAGAYKKQWMAFGYVLILLLSTLQIYGFAHSLHQMKMQQSLVELGTRKQIGLWLQKQVKKDEVVFLEPMGYIGFYSRAKIYDYPGLVSPRVVQIRRMGHGSLVAVIPQLKPDWVVLRLRDIRIAAKSQWIRENYDMVQVFSIQRELDQLEDTTGMAFLYYDSLFYILKKKSV